jgi:uncharacterized oligopeptide transporter (OPT) family protein
MILAAANTYLGLFAGLTIATAIPAAVVSMAVLRLFGGGHILENNIVQTGASAGASISAGVIFTLPALVIINYWPSFNYWWVLAIAGLGGVLGVLFSVPLRRALIVEQNLAFPEGKAAAEVLKAGENPGRGIRILAVSALIGGFAKILAQSGAKLLPDVAATAGSIGKAFAYVGTNLSPALLGVGYIVGLNISIVIVAGGVLSWDIAIPIYTQYFMDTVPAGDAEAVAYAVVGTTDPLPRRRRDARRRHLDAVLAALVAALGRAQRPRGNSRGHGEGDRETEKDLPMKAVLIGLVLFTLPLAVLYQAIVHTSSSRSDDDRDDRRGFPVLIVSAYMAGLVGSSNNPVSGITIATILFASLMLIVLLGSNRRSVRLPRS